jgi:hypothetical protein
MFRENDLVRLITEEGDGEICRVLEDVTSEYESVHIAIGNDDNDDWVDPSDYELVTDDQTVQQSVQQVPNLPDRTSDDIHMDVAKMFVQVAQYVEANVEDSDRGTEITINTDYYNGDNLSISYSVKIGYDDKVTSTDLFRSARIAVDRHNENESLKPLQLPMYKDAAE